MDSVKVVIKDGNCLGCGACKVVCPSDAINVAFEHRAGKYVASINEELCSDCRLCNSVCPSEPENINYNFINNGPIKKVFMGCASNNQIRHDSSSGGWITQMLINAIEAKIIDGAVVTKMSTNPIQPVSYIAYSRDDLIAASGSCYCTSNIFDCLHGILKDNKKLAFVGLPCQILALKKCQKLIPELNDRISITIGLFCGGSSSIRGLRDIFKFYKIPDDVCLIKYRGSGWPGNLFVKHENGCKSVSYPEYSAMMRRGYFYNRCFICPDATNELADISFGDAWNLVDEPVEGTSLIICRNDMGTDFINLTSDDILKEIIDDSLLRKSQSNLLHFKKKSIIFRLRYSKLYRFLINEEKKNGYQLTFMDILNNLYDAIQIYLINQNVPAFPIMLSNRIRYVIAKKLIK